MIQHTSNANSCIDCVHLPFAVYQVDKEFRIINDAYPYIASRLLTDPSIELQSALQRLVFTEQSTLRWERLSELLEVASSTSDYDVTMAVEQMVAYLSTEQAQPIREMLAVQLIESMDNLEQDIVDFASSSIRSSNLRADQVATFLTAPLRNGDNGQSSQILVNAMIQAVENSANSNSSLKAFVKSVNIIRASNGVDSDKALSLIRKVSCQ